MPEPPFPWDSMPDQGEAYVTIDPLLLQAVKEFAWVNDYDRHTLPAVVLMLRVARIDQVDGRLVLGLRFVRELGDYDPGP
jgi:hypothetical protein